jgi:hypothetical protein
MSDDSCLGGEITTRRSDGHESHNDDVLPSLGAPCQFLFLFREKANTALLSSFPHLVRHGEDERNETTLGRNVEEVNEEEEEDREPLSFYPRPPV